MSEVAEKPAKSARILNPHNMGLAEARRRDWVVDAEEGTTEEEVLDPQYWAHMASQLQPMDRIDVRAETGDWLLELIVINRGRNWAQVHLAAKHDLAPRAEIMPAAVKHEIKWKGTGKKFCVIRLADSAVVQEGFEDRLVAAQWLANHERATSA